MGSKVILTSIRQLNLSPDERIEELQLKSVEDAKLVVMFGPKASYSDEEIEEMLSVLDGEAPTGSKAQ